MRFNIKNWLRNWVIILVGIMLGFITGAGWDTVDNVPNFGAGFDLLLNTLGGLGSFGALVGAMLVIVAVVWGVRYMIKTDFTGRKVREWLFLIGTLLVIALAGLVGWSWIQMPSGTGWTTLGFLVVPGLFALLFKNVRTEKTGAPRRFKFSLRRKRTRVNTEETTAPATTSGLRPV